MSNLYDDHVLFFVLVEFWYNA